MIENDTWLMLFSKPSSYSRIKFQGNFRNQGSTVLWMLFILLVFAVLGVTLLLPDYVDAVNMNKKSKKMAEQFTQSNFELTNQLLKLQLNKKMAETAQQKIKSLKNQLEAWGIEQWIEEDYRQASKLSSQGDQLFEQNQIMQAVSLYSSAIAILEELTSSVQQLQTAQLSGEHALNVEDIVAARQQFIIALSIAPSYKRAQNGMVKVATLEKVVAKLNSGRINEKKGQLEDAQADYQAALAIDPGNARTNKLLTRVERKISSEKYRNAMTEGYLALEEKNYAKAKHSFKQAKAINPGSAEVRDALELVEEDYKLSRIRKYNIQAEGFEHNEQWHDAVKIYQAALELDNTLEFALQGKKRSLFYGQVNDDMDYIIQHSYRLASDQPYNSAVSLLKKVNNIEHKGERLKTKLSILDELVKLARILVPITLESDGLTDIVIYKVGKLGRFSKLKLNLYPGKYTAVGSCTGYQDIRKEISVLANQPKAYFIRCEEVI